MILIIIKKELLLMAKEMDKERKDINPVLNMMENLNLIQRKVKENSFIQIVFIN